MKVAGNRHAIRPKSRNSLLSVYFIEWQQSSRDIYAGENISHTYDRGLAVSIDMASRLVSAGVIIDRQSMTATQIALCVVAYLLVLCWRAA